MTLYPCSPLRLVREGEEEVQLHTYTGGPLRHIGERESWKKFQLVARRLDWNQHAPAAVSAKLLPINYYCFVSVD